MPDQDKSKRNQDLVDPSDFCRVCGGSGGDDERTERDTYLWMPCDVCRGTGLRTVRVNPQEGFRHV